MTTYDLKDIKSIYNILVNGAAFSFLLKLSGAGLTFALQILLARTMGETEYGIYTYITAWIMIAVVLSPLGINRTAVKFVPYYISSESYLALRKYIHFIVLLTLATSTLAALILATGVTMIPTIRSNAFIFAFIAGCFLIPINAVVQVGMEIIRGFRRVILSDFSNTILRPVLLMAFVGIYYLVNTAPLTAFIVLISNALIGVFIIFLIYYSVRKLLHPLPNPQDKESCMETNLWLSTAIPLLLVASGNIILGKTDVIMIGSIINTADSGLYNAASRISQLIGIPLLAINMILAPIISQLHAGDRNLDLQKLVRKAAWLSFLSSFSLAFIVYISSDMLLNLFGASFLSQTSPLKILLIGQIASGIAGPAGYLIAMTGHQTSLAIIVCISAIMNIIFNYILIPYYGTTGAAIATITTVIISNILMAWIAVSRISINPSILPFRT